MRRAALRLHYNVDCAHNDLPITPLRLLYAQQKFQEALHEIARLRGEATLGTADRVVVGVHEAIIDRLLRRVLYSVTRARLTRLNDGLLALGDENRVAELRARRIVVATRFRDPTFATELTNRFFDDIPRTPITEAHLRMARGAVAHHVSGPAAAIPFYLTVSMQLATVSRPCLREMATRRLAFCLWGLGDHDEAVAALRHVGLPAGIEPAEGEIALKDLLQVPLM